MYIYMYMHMYMYMYMCIYILYMERHVIGACRCRSQWLACVWEHVGAEVNGRCVFGSMQVPKSLVDMCWVAGR